MNIEAGILLAVSAGILNGTFALPMKLTGKWAWENVWLLFSILSLLVFPFIIVLLSTPHLALLFKSLTVSNILTAVIWGIIAFGGSLLFGISLDYIGVALAFTLLVGSMSIVGIFLPLLIFNMDVLSTAGGLLILSGVLLFLISLFFSFRAGKLKEIFQKAHDDENSSRFRSQITGMILAITGGALSGLLSLGMNMDWTKEIIEKAVQIGHADPSYAGNAALAWVLFGGMVPNGSYSLYLLCKNKSWKLYQINNTRLYWLAILVMAIFYSASVGLWGIAISEKMLGILGPSIGWSLFIGFMVISSNIGGFIAGEWKQAGRKSIWFIIISLAMIASALLLIGYGNFKLNQ